MAEEPSRAAEAPRGGKPSAAVAKTPLGTVAWGLGLYTAARAVSVLLANYAMPATVAQALVAEWGASKLGVVWTDPKRLDDGRATSRLVARAAVGAGVGFAVAGALFALLKVTGAITLEKAQESPLAVALVGLVTAGFIAMRDELLLHGITLRALSNVDSTTVRIVACGLTSTGAALGVPGTSARSAIASGLLGIVFGALWVRDRGAWQAWGAHAGWLFATSTLFKGALVETRVVTSPWAGGETGMTSGYAAVVVLAPFALVALWTAQRSTRTPGAATGSEARRPAQVRAEDRTED